MTDKMNDEIKVGNDGTREAQPPSQQEGRRESLLDRLSKRKPAPVDCTIRYCKLVDARFFECLRIAVEGKCCAEVNCDRCEEGWPPLFVLQGHFFMGQTALNYRPEFKTLEAFTRFMGASAGHARRLMRAAKVYDAIQGAAAIMPRAEWQVRPLVTLTPAKMRDAWATAVRLAHGGQPTSAIVTFAAVAVKMSVVQRALLLRFT